MKLRKAEKNCTTLSFQHMKQLQNTWKMKLTPQMESIEILQQIRGIVQRNRQRCQQNDKRSLRDQKCIEIFWRHIQGKLKRNSFSFRKQNLPQINWERSVITQYSSKSQHLANCHLLSRYTFQNISQSEQKARACVALLERSLHCPLLERKSPCWIQSENIWTNLRFSTSHRKGSNISQHNLFF